MLSDFQLRALIKKTILLLIGLKFVLVLCSQCYAQFQIQI